MSDPGYGNEGRQYPPGGQPPAQPPWGGAPPSQRDPWHGSAPAPSPYGAAPASGGGHGVPSAPPQYGAPGGWSGQTSGGGYGAAPPPTSGGAMSPTSDTRPLPFAVQGSGMPNPGQVSGLPGIGGPGMGGGPEMPSSSRRGPLVPILASATGLLLLLTLVMTGLFIAKSSEQNDTQKALTASRSDVAERDKTIDDQKSQLDTTKQELDKAKQQLDGTKSKLDATSDEKAVISQCLKLVFDFIEAASSGQSGKADALARQLQAPCNRAEVLIGE